LRELRDILAAYARLAAAAERAVLASVVHAAGSTYRRPGARMLITEDDAMIGLIGGGCLEGDLLEHAQRLRAEGTPRVVVYDATAEEDIVWGLGLGCAGVVHVLLERVGPGEPGPLAFLADCARARARGALATAVEGDVLARRVALRAGGAPRALGGGAAPRDPELAAALLRALETGRGSRIVTQGGAWCVEAVSPPLRLVVFGAGPDAAPLVEAAGRLGWDVTVVDGRAAYARAERFPAARAVVHTPFEAAAEALEIDAETYAVVMTHHYLHDRAILRGLLRSTARYVGVLGPKRRTEDLLHDLAGEGIAPEEEASARLFGPAGLDLGADAPEEIALALVAEIQAVAAGRPGGFLRARKGPIHDPPS
jgi:xanthine dehydrogenase accessory factor